MVAETYGIKELRREMRDFLMFQSSSSSLSSSLFLDPCSFQTVKKKKKRDAETLRDESRVVHGAVRLVLGGFFAPHPTGAVSPYP